MVRERLSLFAKAVPSPKAKKKEVVRCFACVSYVQSATADFEMDRSSKTGWDTIFRGDYERSCEMRARPSFFIRLRSVLG